MPDDEAVIVQLRAENLALRQRVMALEAVQVEYERTQEAHKQIEDALRTRAELATRRLEEQMRQSQKMEALGTLAGGIAHEFNNLLAMMRGYTELASYDVPPTSPAYRSLQHILTAGKRAKDLVQQILAFSRPRDDTKQPLEMTLIVREVLTLIRASLPTTIAIRRYLAPDAGLVLADATQIHQMLMNLCANAEYAMRETGGSLEMRVGAVEISPTSDAVPPALKPGAYVRVTVGDTGPGIPADVIDRIFEPFFTTKDAGEGTGMGLAIVHGIVTGHDGVITVNSTPGTGTTFSIYFPRLADAVPVEPHAPEAELHQGTGRILFVDDEEMLALLGKGLLERLGYDVVAYTDSRDALNAFRAAPHHFDLVITDQTMPQLTGATLIQELRQIRADIPIILCTGFSHMINPDKARALGVDAFVMKPGVSQELAIEIQQILAKRTHEEA